MREGAARSTDDGVETYSEPSITASNKHHKNYSAEVSARRILREDEANRAMKAMA